MVHILQHEIQELQVSELQVMFVKCMHRSIPRKHPSVYSVPSLMLPPADLLLVFTSPRRVPAVFA